MEISQIETNLTDAQVELIEHQVKTEKFKNNVQEIFIDVFNQDEFAQKVDSIFNEIFQGGRNGWCSYLIYQTCIKYRYAQNIQHLNEPKRGI